MEEPDLEEPKQEGAPLVKLVAEEEVWGALRP